MSVSVESLQARIIELTDIALGWAKQAQSNAEERDVLKRKLQIAELRIVHLKKSLMEESEAVYKLEEQFRFLVEGQKP